MATESREGRTSLVLYGSETGNARDLADELGRMMERLRFSTYVLCLDAIDPVCTPRSMEGMTILIPD